MKLTTHGQYLIQLTRWSAFNCYLVREEDGFTLVDAIFPKSGRSSSVRVRLRPRILYACTGLGIPFNVIYPLSSAAISSFTNA